ncbi:hypothetical protein [Streptomyces sp. NPDC000994]
MSMTPAGRLVHAQHLPRLTFRDSPEQLAYGSEACDPRAYVRQQYAHWATHH